tara:strand:+ start:6903 stop:7661 length:759 start_codon:yes stop_codon:yes gene_type:complete
LRYFIEFSYVGKQYHGWQKQPNALSVQQVLEDALSKLLRQTMALVGAGRTDAGVHAKQMFAHFDYDSVIDVNNLVYRLNAFLPDDIAVHAIFEVEAGSHARFDAIERAYEYWVIQKKNPFYSEWAHYVKHPLDIKKMNEAAGQLLEYENFECFSKSNTDVKTYLCTIKRAEWVNHEGVLVFTIVANRFLRNMVRAIVGTLLDVGTGKNGVEDVKAIIKSGDRKNAGPSVPAKGLYLTKVLYPKTILNSTEIN